MPPYLAGSAVAMGFWALLYASLGGASRSLLARGANPDALLSDLLERAKDYTSEVALAGAAVVMAAIAVYAIAAVRAQLRLAAGAAAEAGAGSAGAARELELEATRALKD